MNSLPTLNVQLRLLRKDIYGGGDGRAINRHSVRVYVAFEDECLDGAKTGRQIPTCEYTLTRNLDMLPACFEADGPLFSDTSRRRYTNLKNGIFPPALRINDEATFASGKGWPTASKMLCEQIKQDMLAAKEGYATESITVKIGEPLDYNEIYEYLYGNNSADAYQC